MRVPLPRTQCESQSKPGQLEGSKGESQPELVAAAFMVLYIILGRPFYRVLIVTHVGHPQKGSLCLVSSKTRDASNSKGRDREPRGCSRLLVGNFPQAAEWTRKYAM